MFETATWQTLLQFFLLHLLISSIFSWTAAHLLRRRYQDTQRILFLFFLFFNISLPLIGYLFTLFLGYYLLHVRYEPALINTKMLNMEELDQNFPQVKRSFGEGSMVELMSNELAVHGLRMKALSAMAENMTQKNIGMIKHSLSDRDDELRLYSFSLISSMEYGLNNKIHEASSRYRNSQDEEDKADAAKEMALLYWEMVYFDLSDEVLKNYLMDEALKYAKIAATVRAHDKSINVLLGKIYLAKEEFDNATTEFVIAIESGAESEYIVPYLAELYFQSRNYTSIRSMLSLVESLKMSVTMYPIVAQWKDR
jgi:tetratricopeptide (TPR) repeat protein